MSYVRDRIQRPAIERSVVEIRERRKTCPHPSGTSHRTAPDTNRMECDACGITIAVHRWRGPERGWCEDYYYLKESADVR